MKYNVLGSTGLKVSALSFGASSLGSVFKEINEQEGIRTVHDALDLGINLIDVSPYYGLMKAETVLGKALKEVQRDRYLLSTKAGRYGMNEFDFSAKRIVQSLEESLERLNTDYVDFLHLHDVEFGDKEQIIEEALPALRKLKEQGKVRYIGITALPLQTFRVFLEQETVDAIITYCHYSLNDTSLLEFLPFAKEQGFGLIHASPLSMGLLNGRPTADWHPASAELKEACLKAHSYCEERGENLAKLALQFTLANPDIPTTLVSTAAPDNIRRNVQWINEPLNEVLLKEVQQILQPVHNQTWLSGKPEYNEGCIL